MKNDFKELIYTKGYNYHSLGKEIGKSDVTIKRWADGVNEPSCNDLVKLSKILKVSITSLVLMFVK